MKILRQISGFASQMRCHVGTPIEYPVGPKVGLNAFFRN